jgi:DsbC/DsbD-like thiol-disulfide interchange protein
MTAMPNVLAVVAVFAAAVALQEPPSQADSLETRRETRHLTIATSSAAPAAAAGKRLSLLVDVTPKPSMHVYAPGQDGYIAISLTLAPNPAFTAGKARYPAGEKILMPLLKETQIVYAKPFRIAQDVTLKSGTAGPLTIKGTVRYQACDDTVCYLPTNVPVQWTIK